MSQSHNQAALTRRARPAGLTGLTNLTSLRMALIMAIGLGLAGDATRAQAPASVPATAGTAATADPALLTALGGPDGLRRIAAGLVQRAKADSLIGHQFKDTKSEHLTKQLSDQICQLLGGGCAYDGESMKKSHGELKITKADFNRLVELLQDAMTAEAVPFATQNRLLALLAPMHRDIITR